MENVLMAISATPLWHKKYLNLGYSACTFSFKTDLVRTMFGYSRYKDLSTVWGQKLDPYEMNTYILTSDLHSPL